MIDSTIAELSPWDLGLRNSRLLGERDIVVAGDPGAGAALISNIVFELGFGYLDPYTEILDEHGSARVTEDRLSYYRQRLSATAAGGPAPADSPLAANVRTRFVKTHFYPDHFADIKLGGAVLLVRDPRDTIFSSYKWFCDFSESWLPIVADASEKLSFTEFLDRVRIGDGEPSIPGWARFYSSWLEAAPAFSPFAIVRFEDLKANPVGTITALLATFGLDVPAHLVIQAAERSSFGAMRAREDKISAAEGDSTKGARIMRRGKTGEWREWYGSSGMADRFADPGLIATAARFGYDVAAAAGAQDAEVSTR